MGRGKKKSTSARSPLSTVLRPPVGSVKPFTFADVRARGDALTSGTSRRDAVREMLAAVDNVATKAFGAPVLTLPPLPSAPGTKVRPAVAVLDENLTDEQRAVRAAGEAVVTMMRDSGFRNVVESMVAIRQSYAVAYRELQEQVARLQNTDTDADVVDHAVQYAMYQAGKPFSEHVLMRAIVDYVLPWLAAVIDRHTDADETHEIAARREAEEARGASAIPVGFSHTFNQDGANLLTRDRSVVLVGWAPAIRHLLDKAELTALQGLDDVHFTVIRFTERPVDRADLSNRVIRVNDSHWAGCANTRRGVAEVMGTRVADKLSANPDLVICDALDRAFTGGLVRRPPGAAAGEAHRMFRMWCNEARCGFLGGICLPDRTTPDLTGPEWEQLRTFADVRQVTVEPGAEDYYYIVTVGNRASVFVVDQLVLNADTTSSIVVPAGVSTGETSER